MDSTKTSIILNKFLKDKKWLNILRDGDLLNNLFLNEYDENPIEVHLTNSLKDILNLDKESMVYFLISKFDVTTNSTKIECHKKILHYSKIIDYFKSKFENIDGICISLTNEEDKKVSWLIIKS